jgi:hypothetical protein
MRPLLLPAAIVVLGFPASAFAQALSNDMTCAEAVAHYEKHGRIDTNLNGQILPIYGGVPVSERAGMWCDEDEAPTETFVKTRDRAQCAISYSCPGE